MVRRIIALFLVCILAIPIFTVTASASEYELSHFELLDMGYWEVGGQVTTSFQLDANETGLFSTPNRIRTAYIYYTTSSAGSITVNGTALSPTEVTPGIYTVTWNGNANSLRITPSVALQITSVRTELSGTTVVDVPINFTGEVQGVTASLSDQLTFSQIYTSSGHSFAKFSIKIPYEKIKDLDYYHTNIFLLNVTVTGLTVSQAGSYMPFSTGSFVFDTHPDALSENAYRNYFPLAIDVSSCRSKQADLEIIIYGECRFDNYEYSVQFMCTGSKGIINTPSVNPVSALLANVWASIKEQTVAFMDGFSEVFTWFNTIKEEIVDTRQYILNYLSELFSGEDAGDPQDFNSDVDQQETQFQEMVDTMETAPTVAVEDITNTLDSLINIKEQTTNILYMEMISGLMQLEFLAPVFLFCGILCILGYLLYGKR